MQQIKNPQLSNIRLGYVFGFGVEFRLVSPLIYNTRLITHYLCSFFVVVEKISILEGFVKDHVTLKSGE